MNTNQAKMDGVGTGFEVSTTWPFDGLNFHDEIWLLSVGNRPKADSQISRQRSLKIICFGALTFDLSGWPKAGPIE